MDVGVCRGIGYRGSSFHRGSVITLVLGGVRSGKSEVAERLAGPGPGTYLATGLVAPGDDDFADRVARHRARRPASWATVEEPRAVPEVLARLHGPCCSTPSAPGSPTTPGPTSTAWSKPSSTGRGDTVVVSEEVGLGVHPMTEVGRLFADRLGEANRRVAEVADRCLLVVAGRVIDLPAGLDDGLRPDTGSAATCAGRTFAGAPRRLAGGGLRPALAFLTPAGRGRLADAGGVRLVPGRRRAARAACSAGSGGPPRTPSARSRPPALVVAADLALTGALHFDGLLDSADGLLPHLPAERRLAVMADPTSAPSPSPPARPPSCCAPPPWPPWAPPARCCWPPCGPWPAPPWP